MFNISRNHGVGSNHQSFSISSKTNFNKFSNSMETEIDFISELPDPLLHHILSFLDMIFVIRTSILSKRWRYMWSSTHFLNFNEDQFNTIQEAEPPFSSKDHFMDFVNRVLFLHCKSNINTFSISGFYPRLIPRLWTWMNYNPWLPIRREAEESENRRTLILPLCFFNSKTLTTLKLDMGSMKGRQIFKIPDSLIGSSVGLPCLKTLHLGSLLLVDGDCISSFISKCLALETLIISNCLLEERNNLIIYGVQLKNLELGISCVRSTEQNGKITVFTPNLTFFQCRDLLLSEFYLELENVSALLYADFDACLASRPDCLSRFSHNYLPQREEEYIHNVLKCLRNVCNVKSLSLYMCPLEDILGVRSGLEDLLNPFYNLKVLKFKTMFSRKHILRVAILEMCPHIETLILERTSGVITRPPLDWSGSISVDQKIEPWKMKAPQNCLSYSLKFLEVRGAYGTLDEFKFLRFLLRNAMVLVKLVILTCESNSHHSSKECLQRFSEKLVALPKASPNVEISFFNSAKL